MKLDHPWALWLLPLVLLPLITQPGPSVANAWVALLPRDRASVLLSRALRGAGVLALAALVVGIAGPYRAEYDIQRVGKGAEIVLVLDRSRSMDQGFAGARPDGAAPRGTGPEALEYYARLAPARLRESKGKVARQLLAEFAAKRPEDRFAMVVFSTLPIPVLAFTQKSAVVQAAISAGNIGRGLSETNIALALRAALTSFEERPYTGSRSILLVSDGGDRLDEDARERIGHLARKHRASIYWIYLRSGNSPGLPDAGEPPQDADVAVAEVALHRYFESIGTPYRAFEAGDPQALQQAIDAVDRLENLPITYFDTVARRDLAPWCWGVAWAAVLLLLAASALEVRRWR